ncbi:MAG: hypothetical protein ACR2QJ_05755, partial [Geminicoccaceae bacterium]
MQQVNDRWRRCWTLVVAVLFVFTIVTVFLVNLIPLEIAGSIDEGLSELAAGLGFRLDDSISISLVQRLIVYVPLGLLTYALIALRKLRAPFLGTILLVALVGLSVEMLQGFFSKRHAFSFDFLLVLIVGVLAALSGEILRGLLARRRLALLHLLLLGNVLGLSAIWLAHRGSDLTSWDCSYPLVIGNEATADRPWLGRLRGVAIYDRALADGQIGALSAGSGGQDGVDRRDLGAALVRPFDDDGELEIARPTLVQAMQDATGLCEAIKASQAFTIEIEFASLDLDQRGPARILSMSLDPERRNVTLGQDGGRLSLRIRNELNGANGIEQEITTA